MEKGYIALMLHAHLPFVRHPEHEFFTEELWLYEALTEKHGNPVYERIDALEKTQAESRSVMIPRPLYRWPLGLALFFLLLLGLFPDGIPRAWFTRRAHG